MIAFGWQPKEWRLQRTSTGTAARFISRCTSRKDARSTWENSSSLCSGPLTRPSVCCTSTKPRPLSCSLNSAPLETFPSTVSDLKSWPRHRWAWWRFFPRTGQLRTWGSVCRGSPGSSTTGSSCRMSEAILVSCLESKSFTRCRDSTHCARCVPLLPAELVRSDSIFSSETIVPCWNFTVCWRILKWRVLKRTSLCSRWIPQTVIFLPSHRYTARRYRCRHRLRRCLHRRPEYRHRRLYRVLFSWP